jgi:alkylation response protein AidB-like acyl-CoA dehydrogenase
MSGQCLDELRRCKHRHIPSITSGLSRIDHQGFSRLNTLLPTQLSFINEPSLPVTKTAGVWAMIFPFINRADLEFQLFDVLNVDALCSRAMYVKHDVTTFKQVLNTAYDVATDFFAPHAALSDAQEPVFNGNNILLIPEIKRALDAYSDAGLTGATFAEEFGGLQLPFIVGQAANAIFYAANISTAAYPLLTVGAANLIAAFGTQEQKKNFLRPMIDGRWFGTMCLSETQAGSSLADTLTRATPKSGNEYLIRGSKMWISCGDHDLSENIVHLVLAKIENAPAGVRGISLFIVPKFLVEPDGQLGRRNGVALAGINHKMGYRGTVNTLLNFGEGEDCVGYLVGEAHHGLSYMFQMMNEARIGVGLGATMCGYAGYMASLQYARERLQGRHPESKDPTSAQVPIIQHADVRRLLLTQKCYVEGALSLSMYCAFLVDELRTATDENVKRRAGLLLEVLTPIAKSWPSEFCLEANKHAIQVLGGYGYTREFPLERLYRDNRLNAIHEGTHGIQGIDLLGRKVVMLDGAAFAALGANISLDIQSASRHGELSENINALRDAWELAEKVTKLLVEKRSIDLRRALSDSSVYLDMLGHIVISWMWIRQAATALVGIKIKPDEKIFYEGKVAACNFFFERDLPKIRAQAEVLTANNGAHYSINEKSF